MRVLLGVTGGIAAYKAADLTSRLVKVGHEMHVVMTEAATRFVGSITFEALCGHPVMVDLWEAGGSVDGATSVRHISWAKWADVAVLAPLSASTLGKLYAGIADNALTTVWLALPADVPQVLCPAMNTRMWEHAATQRNVAWLEENTNAQVVSPVVKRLAEGEVGMGAMAEPADILAAIEARGR